MPIHDWTRVTASTWHDFHLAWIAEIRNALNGGLLPPDYYAQAEQVAGLRDEVRPTAVVVANPLPAPAARFVFTAEMDEYALKRQTLVIRHASGDRIIALVELVCPANKTARHAFRSFQGLAVEAIHRGFHLLVVDLFPPTPRAPRGIHGAIWGEIADTSFEQPPDEPLTLAAYSAGPHKQAYVEPTAVGRELLEMPLFLEPEVYVNVPLEATYTAAYRGVPRKWQQVLG